MLFPWLWLKCVWLIIAAGHPGPLQTSGVMCICYSSAADGLLLNKVQTSPCFCYLIWALHWFLIVPRQEVTQLSPNLLMSDEEMWIFTLSTIFKSWENILGEQLCVFVSQSVDWHKIHQHLCKWLITCHLSFQIFDGFRVFPCFMLWIKYLCILDCWLDKTSD